jgi:hypothetical protein
MIDYIALAIGHGLLAFALIHLFLREEVDVDPLIDGIKAQMRHNRMQSSSTGRSARRRAATDSQQAATDDPENGADR